MGKANVLIMQNGTPAKLLILRKSDNHVEKEIDLRRRTHQRTGSSGTCAPPGRALFLVAHMDFGKVVEYSPRVKRSGQFPRGCLGGGAAQKRQYADQR